MDHRSDGRRDLVLLATAVVGLTRLADGPLLWLAAGLVLVGVLVGALGVLGEGEPRGVPIESLLLPATAALAGVFGLRLLPVGPVVLAGLAVVAVLIDRSVALEQRLEALPTPPSTEDRTRVVGLAVGIAFLAFAGIAATVPGGLVTGGTVLGPPGGALVGSDLALLAGADAAVAFLLGYRVAALRVTTVRDAAWSALTYAIVVAIGAGAVRALAVPRLLGPALLTLVFFLWDALHGTAPTRRRDPRWLWEIGLLVALAIVVVALNTRLTV
jgi:hypothetical protein